MIDKVEIRVIAGDGGDGVVSFRREKHVPFGGPDGGDGGNGGDVVAVAAQGIASLRTFKKGGLYRAERGEDGHGKKKHGKNGADLVLAVPVGTVVFVAGPDSGAVLLADLAQPGERVVVAKGGKGGVGNIHFVSSTNQAPRIAQKGEAGEENNITLELRLIADVGIIGLPNAGKSTLLAAASAAHPKIASYPFTTLEPMLGLVEVKQSSFVLAEIPGLIEGAHLGKGLGHDFLRHARRTKMLIHLVDGTSGSPVEDVARVNAELSLFDVALGQKPQITVVNKIDIPEVQSRRAELERAFIQAGKSVRFISAAGRQGVAELMVEALKMLGQLATEEKVAVPGSPGKVFRPQPRETGINVHKDGEVFVVVAPWLERIIARVDVSDPEIRGQLRRQLALRGGSRALAQAGVKPGDKVRCGNFEWEW